jgi:hypothetical protein
LTIHVVKAESRHYLGGPRIDHSIPSAGAHAMRWILASCLLCVSSLALAQENDLPAKKAEPDPVSAYGFEFPRDAKVGDVFNVTAKIRNNIGRLALVSLRLNLDDSHIVLPPNAEQTAFVEVGEPRIVAWRVKRISDHPLEGNVESNMLITKSGPGKVPNADRAPLEKEWEGRFGDKTSEFGARMKIVVRNDGAVEGKIFWKLLKHTDEARKPLIGKEGIEYVWGSYDSKTRLLAIDGYRRSDPFVILGLDRYRLTLAEEGIRLKGTTWNQGANDGKFTLTPVEE